MNGEMDALVKARPGKGLELAKVPIPKVGYAEVLIRIHKTAICGTDLHIYNWDAWSQAHIHPPLVVGHEYVGEIAEMGSQVKHFEIGQTVSGEGHLVCGQCRNCRAGRAQWCAHTQGVGVNRDGAFAQYLCIPASNCIPISPDLDEEVVAFFDAFGNATHTALMFDVVGEDVLITGAGPIGIMAVAVARHCGARHVVITDVNEYRLALARRMGATLAVNVAERSLESVMQELGMTEGFDVGLEMSGVPSAFAAMLDAMNHGGRVAVLGIPPPDMRVDWTKIVFKGLTVKGIYGREMFETWYRMAGLIHSGLDLEPVITHRLPLADFQAGFEIMASGRSGKIILDWESA